MSAEEQDDAMGRLGGPSRITALEEKVANLMRRLDEKTSALETAVFGARAQVDSEFWADGCDDLIWHDQSGVPETYLGTCTIVGIGTNWCVARRAREYTDDGRLFFTALPDGDVRRVIGPHVQ